MASTVTVIKNDHLGQEVWRYEAQIVVREGTHVILEAYFKHPTEDALDLGYVTFRHGDRMIETFYGDRWYNVFEIHDVDDDRLKGWYCNFTRPAHITDGIVQADDLALDLFVYPDRRTQVLDEDEFAALPLAAAERNSVRAALEDLQRLAAQGREPFITTPAA